MEEVQFKALELLSQMNNNSQISVLSQTPNVTVSTDKTSRGFTINDELVHKGSFTVFLGTFTHVHKL